MLTGARAAVRFVQAEAIEQQLEMGSVVLLSSLAYSAAGEVLNCNAYEVATHAAVELRADKLIVLTLDAVADLGLPQWLPLNDAEELMAAHMARAAAAGDPVPPGVCRVGNLLPAAPAAGGTQAGPAPLPELQLDLDWCAPGSAAPASRRRGHAPDARGAGRARSWQALRFPNSLLAAVAACKEGVRRAHLVDARVDGGLLLELYSRDGMGTMISTDFYECAPALMRLLAGAGGRSKSRRARAGASGRRPGATCARSSSYWRRWSARA